VHGGVIAGSCVGGKGCCVGDVCGCVSTMVGGVGEVTCHNVISLWGWAYNGFSFSGPPSGLHFLVFASFNNILQTVVPFLSAQVFLDSPQCQLFDNTKVYGFLIDSSHSGPHSVTMAPTNELSHRYRPSHGLPMARTSHQRMVGHPQHVEPT
jgi:hypothetical protein